MMYRFSSVPGLGGCSSFWKFIMLGRQQKCAQTMGAQRRCPAKARKVPMLRQLCTRARDNDSQKEHGFLENWCTEIGWRAAHEISCRSGGSWRGIERNVSV